MVSMSFWEFLCECVQQGQTSFGYLAVIVESVVVGIWIIGWVWVEKKRSKRSLEKWESRVKWAGPILCAAVAVVFTCFVAPFRLWKDEHDKVSTLMADIAYFSETGSRLALGKLDPHEPRSEDVLMAVELNFKNTGGHPADFIRYKVVYVPQNQNERRIMQAHESQSVGEIGKATNYNLHLLFSPIIRDQDLYPFFVFVQLKYRDVITGETLKQSFYRKWSFPGALTRASTLDMVSPQERRWILDYAKVNNISLLFE